MPAKDATMFLSAVLYFCHLSTPACHYNAEDRKEGNRLLKSLKILPLLEVFASSKLALKQSIFLTQVQGLRLS